MTDGDPASDQRGAVEIPLSEALADGVVVLAPDGLIGWANDAFTRMVGMDVSEVVGQEGLAMIHPDEVARAIDGIVYASQFPGRTAVAPYRIRKGDGTWLDIELKSGLLERPDGDHLVLVVRDGTARRAVNRALKSVANGEPLERTAALVSEAVRSRWPNTGVAVSLGELDGSRTVHADGLSPQLVAHASGTMGAGPDGAVEVAPWAAVGPTVEEDVTVVDQADMSERLRKAATAEGYEGFAVARISDPSGEPGCLVVWFDHTVIARLEFTHAASELTELLGLALERRHHLWQLWHMARHDSLTGLLNRVGFGERFEVDLVEARAAGEVVGVLYIDLDGLKLVNDHDGHAAGDRLLVAASRRLDGALGATGLLGRLGGDEFVVTYRLPATDARSRCEDLADGLVAALAADATPGSVDVAAPVRVAASLGLVLDDGHASADDLLERADAAMYRAKTAGRSRWSH